MAKPILLIQVPFHVDNENMIRIKETVSKEVDDWHILVARTSVSEVLLGAYSEQNVIEIDIDKLQEMLLKQGI